MIVAYKRYVIKRLADNFYYRGDRAGGAWGAKLNDARVFLRFGDVTPVYKYDGTMKVIAVDIVEYNHAEHQAHPDNH